MVDTDAVELRVDLLDTLDSESAILEDESATLDAVVKAGYKAILSNYNAWYLVYLRFNKKSQD